ncbi:MAG: VOC family protein [Anaerolineae bacterium]|nr:VOC family protein [Anaerolineae bacterium]
MADQASPSTLPTLPADLSLGYVHLTVSDLERSLVYYQESLGFQVHQREGNTAHLGAGEADMLLLTEQADALPLTRTTGLYHFAILVPSRRDLAEVLDHLFSTQSPVGGFADHAVSEAIYLSDPDGNGIEIYRDRPRSDWYDKQGNFLLTTLPLDIDGVLSELSGATRADHWAGLPKGTVLGHMHLKVATLAEAHHFYCEVLGFDLMLSYPGALFISAGGYHHHLGLNIWESAGAPPPPANAVGLRGFTVLLSSAADLAAIKDRLLKNNIAIDEGDQGFTVRDPFDNALIFTVR